MTEISAYEQERLKHVNTVMDNIHEKTSEIYEGLVDREHEDSLKAIDSLIKELTEVRETISEEI